MAMAVNNNLHTVGDVFIFLGATVMVILSIVALILLVALLLAAMANGHDHGHGHSGSGGFFCFWGFSSPSAHCYGYYYPLAELMSFIIMGLIASAIVVGVALHMGMPMIALGLGVSWCAAFSMILVGFLAHSMGSASEARVVYDTREPSSTVYERTSTRVYASNSGHAFYHQVNPPVAVAIAHGVNDDVYSCSSRLRPSEYGCGDY